VRLADLPAPRTPAITAAEEVLRRFSPPVLVNHCHRAYPRLDLAERFAACFRDQARRKPDSTAGAAVRSGLTERLAANPLERIGQDEV
jgi:hypothetical protein